MSQVMMVLATHAVIFSYYFVDNFFSIPTKPQKAGGLMFRLTFHVKIISFLAQAICNNTLTSYLLIIVL